MATGRRDPQPRRLRARVGQRDPSAYEITLTPGYPPQRAGHEIRHVLGPTTGLTVESARQRDELQRTARRQGLGRLSQISTLVLLAGLLATVTAMGAMIWQRRRRFARLKVQGYATGVLWAALICESASLLLVGCLLGAVLGIYGQLLLSHALLSVTGMPVIFSSRVATRDWQLPPRQRRRGDHRRDTRLSGRERGATSVSAAPVAD